MFEEYQTAADELFCTMPPPQPAVDNFDYDRWGQGGNVPYQPRAPVNMADYMNNQGGCFSGDALVLVYIYTMDVFICSYQMANARKFQK